MNEAIEVVVFQPRAGVSAQDVETAAQSITPVLESLDGYISRDFGRADGGRYIDVVRWRDLSAAQAAADKVMQEPACGAFFSLIDETQMQMTHYSKL
ncbi:antibiotic biosynthesis monooxygenase family protein [Allohahella sp. A8]|uniref:antibiotic biosynthesis monooxygenase family protein n=1 Tax=Allohahella sp. A8 TaxID=3141461 RepID=UPI003A7FB40D